MERTIAIFKPNVAKNHLEEALSIIEEKGFEIMDSRSELLSREIIHEFYGVYQDKPFWNQLVEYMTSGECFLLSLKKENAIMDFRNLIGATDPKQADVGTLRNLFAETIDENGFHGSDSEEAVLRESKILNLKI